MPKGGARSRSGPPPDPHALRRGRAADGEWTVLPRDGRRGRAPTWPLEEETSREHALWLEFWKLPQALLWEHARLHHQVAMHVRCLAEAEQPEAATTLRNLVRQQAEGLLLTLPAMHAARVRLEEPPAAATSGGRPGLKVVRAPSARERLAANAAALQAGDDDTA